LYFANLALLCVFAVKFSFFNRKVRKGMRKGRKENVQFLPVYSIGKKRNQIL